MVFDLNDSGSSAPSPRHQQSPAATHQKMVHPTQHIPCIPEDHSRLVHSMEFPLKDSAVSRYIPMTCGKPCSPIAHKTSRMRRHLLLTTSVKPCLHVLTHHRRTRQQRIQDLSVLHIKASFLIRLAAALHDNHTDLNGLVAQHTRIRMISYCIQGCVYHSFTLTYILRSACMYTLSTLGDFCL